MKITMQESRWVTVDGVSLRHLSAGHSYDLPTNLAFWLLCQKYAVHYQSTGENL